MKKLALGLSLAAVAASAITALPARAAPNPGLCFALAENFNQCQRQAQRQSRGGNRGYGGYGGYGYDGDGYDGGGWDDEDAYDWRRRRAGRAQAKQAECARWLVAMQQNNCM